MDNVEIPRWLKGLPLAPEFRPTETEFADPIAYISKIEKEARAFGICKVIPPLPKPSKRYVLNNLNKSLLKSRELYSHVDLTATGASSKKGSDTNARATFTTRQQELGQSSKKSRTQGSLSQPEALKQVWESGEVYTLDEFESKAKAFSRSILGKIKDVCPQVVETLFWKATDEKPIYIEYANDVPGSGFGKPEGLQRYLYTRKRRRRKVLSQRLRENAYDVRVDEDIVRTTSSGIGPEELVSRPYPSHLEQGNECGSQPNNSSNVTSGPSKHGGVHSSVELEGTAGWNLSNSPWNLQVIARSAGSLTRFMLDDIPGVTSPMVYIGMLFSWFAWHVEDHELHSLNFLHMGSPKAWYAVPGDYAFAFEELIRRHAYGGDFDNLASLKLLGEKTTLLSPEFVIASGIPCCRLVQNPGEFVVTFPRAYHVGFSHGFNCGEAANFGTPQWLTLAKDAAVRRAAMDHLPMLSHQQLLYLLTMSFVSRIPKSLLTGVRSSRLRDCLKTQRELLVKKAFIEDLMRGNDLLNNLLGKDSAFRAVLWHPDSLLSFTKDTLPQISTVLDVSYKGNNELSKIIDQDAGSDGVTNQSTSFMETVDDFYLDCDLSREFQVDSGTLPCVACGILGYPFMSVVQPCKKASIEISRADYPSTSSDSSELYSHLCNTKNPASDSNIDEKWDTSGMLRPRIFCLEHAVQIEELLRLRGGSRMLIICHSDFPRIKASAAAIAEEVGTAFHYKEVLFNFASRKELDLIDLAIDGEQPTDCEEDWTSKLGMNLRFAVKSRISCPPKKIEHASNLEYLLSIIAPGSVFSIIQWCSRKPRTKRDSNRGKCLKLDDVNNSKMDGRIHEKSGSLEIKEKVLLQYSRRKYGTQSKNDSGPTCISGHSNQCSPEVADENCGNVDGSAPETSGEICVKHMEADLEKSCMSSLPKRWVVPHDEVEMIEATGKHVSDTISTDLVDSLPFDAVVQLSLPCDTSISTSVDPIPRKTRVNKDGENSSEDLSSGNCCCSPDSGIIDKEKLKIVGSNNMRAENGCIAETSDLMTISSSRELCDKQDGRDLGLSCVSDDACYATCVTDVTDGTVQDSTSIKLELHDHAASRTPEFQGVNETCKQDSSSTFMKSTTSLEEDISMPNPPKQKPLVSWQSDFQGCPLQLKEQNRGKTIVDGKMTPGINSKRAREVVQLTGAHSDFVRSPCEGLRPRKKKEFEQNICKVDRVSEQKDCPAMKSKKASNISISHCRKMMNGDARYKCEMDGCQMCFTTKAELSLHKRNRCHYEECGKRFRSHRYVVLHQRVHDNKRPLKCTWKDCSMTFKWAWARTEHLRLHTGERPYKCEVEGCGLTFRFVSDFSRHKRKTGHSVSSM